ncbi:recombinase RecT [Vibrio coralliilyticus]|uniref:recombinase RecT n=1 Tax=Vibrio coralliilyticus TaxID=190893 RepID=UPI000BAC14DD|nr:recombinase RecT [Vibrio coralliilyticus]PAW00444.1 hypothetical protein CKJ79_26935 [Vibrio coralliilyticus]
MENQSADINEKCTSADTMMFLPVVDETDIVDSHSVDKVVHSIPESTAIFLPVPDVPDNEASIQNPEASKENISDAVEASYKKLSDDVLKYWKAIFQINDQFIDVVASALDYWDCPIEGERELFFFLCSVTSKSYQVDNGTSNPYAPCNADLNSVRQGLQVLAASKATFDPLLTTAYHEVRFEKETGRYRLTVGTNYKGKVLAAKQNGIIKDVMVRLVYSNDKFEWKGKDAIPRHYYDPFAPLKSRGNLIAGYTVSILDNQECMSHLVMASELSNLLDMSRDKDIVANWHEKMLLKSVINQTESTWHYFVPNKHDELSKKVRRTKLTEVGKYMTPFLSVYQLGVEKRKVINAIAYAITFFQDEVTAVREAESILMAIYDDVELAKASSYSLISMVLALEKYSLSAMKGKDHVFFYASKNGVPTAEVGVMYKGCREIAFNKTFKGLLPPVDKIDYQVVRANDTFVYKGRYRMPEFRMAPIEQRGEVIGGYVAAHRGDKLIVSYVRRETMDKVAACAHSGIVKNKWPEKYAIKTILRQSFLDWL